MRTALNNLIIIAFFYFVSLIERRITNIDFTNPNKKEVAKKIGIGFIIFVVASFWIMILFGANQKIIAGDE